MRLRSGELPISLVTVKPIPGSSFALAMACSENAERPTRWPRAALRNSDRFLRRRTAPSTGMAVSTANALGRELLAADGATAGENGTTVLGRHAGAKTVAAGADERARLESAFRHTI